MATRVSSRMATNAEATRRTTVAVVRPVGWWSLGIARILVGYLWYQQILWKLPPNFSGNNGLRQWMLREVAHPLVPLYGAFVRDVALTHYHLFGWITFLIEAAIALSLILGLFGRLVQLHVKQVRKSGGEGTVVGHVLTGRHDLGDGLA